MSSEVFKKEYNYNFEEDDDIIVNNLLKEYYEKCDEFDKGLKRNMPIDRALMSNNAGKEFKKLLDEAKAAEIKRIDIIKGLKKFRGRR